MNEFHSEYADVVYNKRDNVVLLTWKKRAIIDQYREPTTFALKLLQQNVGSNFVVDARNGFEDDKSDVEWGFTFLLPKMAETTCKFVGFIMDEENEIGEEMDMGQLNLVNIFLLSKQLTILVWFPKCMNIFLWMLDIHLKKVKEKNFYVV